MSYAYLLKKYIKKSGKTLEQISKECSVKGVAVHPTYISKLRLGQRPAPSEEITKTLAEVTGGDPQRLIIEGYMDKTPPAVRSLIKDVNDIDAIFNEFESVEEALNRSIEAYIDLSTDIGDEINVNDHIYRLVADLAKEDKMKIEKNNYTPQEFKKITLENLSAKNKFLIFIYMARLAEMQGENLYDLVKRVEDTKNTGSQDLILQKYKNAPPVLNYSNDRADNPKLETKQNVFGEKIKRLRLERNLTINELADMTDLDPQHLADLEEGKHEPEWNAISELAEPLNISEFELAKGTPYEISQETLEKMRKQALAASEMIAQISKSLEPTMKVYQTVFKAFQESIDNILDSAEFKRFMESIQEITKAAREVQKENESINAMLPEKNENEEKKEDPE
ncbi:helix-turn-helix domain-containing protein [Paludifilum halophilum]|uniref:HTH cro/C1-type domain-containing protein n=1 Tax=Paludifilum halophilum TaxID=1642702 RepID=A0A235B917_9BACL|nr:helix-turn-helix transcriptional regulator [Paludifilum halophilum]OYD08766.1 hypothetical protein CHM34_02920 [Paludifilum halophilum]